jgi:hypothetical protein
MAYFIGNQTSELVLEKEYLGAFLGALKRSVVVHW